MRTHFLVLLPSLVLLGLPMVSLHAEIPIEKVQMKDGTSVIGKVDESSDTLTVDIDKVGKIAIPKSGVLSRSVNPPPKLWTADISLGYSMSRGNSDTDSFSSTTKVNRKTAENETTFQESGLYSKSAGVMNAQQYIASARYAYSFGPRKAWYQFFKQEAQHDKFALVQIRSTSSSGLGYWWSDTQDFRMMAELGLGFEHTDWESGRSRTNQGVAIPRFYIEKRLWASCRLSEDLSSSWGSQEQIAGHQINSETKFTSPVSQRVSLDITLTDHYSSMPPAGAKNNDAILMNSLRYSF